MFPLRDENPTLLTPYFTIALIALNVVVWLYVQGAGLSDVALADAVCRFGAIPAELTGRTGGYEGIDLGPGLPPCEFGGLTWGAVFTSMFMHGSWVHLLGNMLFLHVFGTMTEARMGRARFTLFYVCCGYLALLGYALADTGSPQSVVGASGAISAVLGAFLFLFPRARVTSLLPFLFFLPVRFPAWVVLPFWAALQWLGAGRASDGPGVAYLAHLVGFGLGLACAWVCSGRTTTVRATPAPAPEGENQP